MLRLIAVVVAGLFAAPFLPHEVLQGALALSLTIKECLLFFLPFIIFSFLVACLSQMREGMLGFLSLVVLALCFSNFTTSMFSFGLMKLGLFDFVTITAPSTTLADLQPLWPLKLPRLITNDQALLSGCVVGLLLGRLGTPSALRVVDHMKAAASWALNHLFLPILPLFVLGFLLKLQHDGGLSHMVISYAAVFLVLAVVCTTYITLIYGLAARFQPTVWSGYLRTISPAAFSAFCTMSSAATMPLSIAAAEKNTGRPDAARVIIPATLSIHLIGDALCAPILAMLVMVSFGHGLPSINEFMIFAGYMVLAKFAVAAVPGGGILVILPLLEAHLAFTPEMSALILALYMLFDPLITSTNVSGNGAFAVFLSRFMPSSAALHAQKA